MPTSRESIRVAWHISSYSENGGVSCVEAGPVLDAAWHISSYSDNGGGNCVEAGPVLVAGGRVAVRHSHHPAGPAIVYPSGAWQAFVARVKHGTYDFRR